MCICIYVYIYMYIYICIQLYMYIYTSNTFKHITIISWRCDGVTPHLRSTRNLEKKTAAVPQWLPQSWWRPEKTNSKDCLKAGLVGVSSKPRFIAARQPVYIYIYIHTCIHACMYVCIYIYIYIYNISITNNVIRVWLKMGYNDQWGFILVIWSSRQNCQFHWEKWWLTSGFCGSCFWGVSAHVATLMFS